MTRALSPLLILLGFALVPLAGCGDDADVPSDATAPEALPPPAVVDGVGRQAGTRPDSLTISADSLQANLDREIAEQTAATEDVAVAEALAAVTETQAALVALADEDAEAATAALERAVGKLEVLLARRPELGLVPLDVTTEVVDTATGLEAIERLTDAVEDLTDDGHFQAARLILENLVSELRITTTSLPLATYPDAIRRAARAVEEGNLTAARRVLAGALSTLVVETRAIPLPVIDAEAMVEGAEALVEEGETSLALAMLADAQYQLSRAEALGYGERDREFAALDEAIEELSERIEDEEESGSAFDALRERLARFKSRVSG
jgi:hypothetical protein